MTTSGSPRHWPSSWPLLATETMEGYTDHGCGRNTDPDPAFGNNPGLVITMGGGLTSHLNLLLTSSIRPLSQRTNRSASLSSSFSTMYWLTVTGPAWLAPLGGLHLPEPLASDGPWMSSRLPRSCGPRLNPSFLKLLFSECFLNHNNRKLRKTAGDA